VSYVRTPEHKKLRAALILSWKPWEHSTGPKSRDGKKRSAMRGYKGSERSNLRTLSRVMKSQEKALAAIAK
jgi:hypothetical protein